MMDSTLTKKDAVVVHESCGRPAEPPIGMIYLDYSTGYREQWDGFDWIPLKKAPNGK